MKVGKSGQCIIDHRIILSGMLAWPLGKFLLAYLCLFFCAHCIDLNTSDQLLALEDTGMHVDKVLTPSCCL